MNKLTVLTTTPPKAIQSDPDSLIQTYKASLKTSQQGKDVNRLFRQIITPTSRRREARILFNKVSRSIDRNNTHLAAAKQEIEGLNLQVTSLPPRKRQKINNDPNGRFVQIGDVMRSREHWADVLAPHLAAKELNELQFQDLCDQWQLQC